jgi:predicted methyltransferase
MLSNGKKGGKMNEYVGGNTKRARGQNGQRGRIMIPVNIRRNMKLEPGKVFEVLTSNEKILIYRLVK